MGTKKLNRLLQLSSFLYSFDLPVFGLPPFGAPATCNSMAGCTLTIMIMPPRSSLTIFTMMDAVARNDESLRLVAPPSLALDSHHPNPRLISPEPQPESSSFSMVRLVYLRSFGNFCRMERKNGLTALNSHVDPFHA